MHRYIITSDNISLLEVIFYFIQAKNLVYMLYFYLCSHIMAYIQGLCINVPCLFYFFIVLCSFWRPIVNIISPIFIRLYFNISRRIIGFYIIYPTRHLLHVIRPNMYFHTGISFPSKKLNIS